LLGGTLNVSSEEGKGSIFSFELDCIACEQTNDSTSSKHKENIREMHLNVLVVEDNEVNLMVALGMLKRQGCVTESRSNGLEAIEAVSSGNFDLVLMDCHMPVMDGFEATRRIRNLQNKNAKLPIVALTASAMKEDVQACYDAGMNDVLTKPLSMEDLRNKLITVHNGHI